jgi:hypothetical protein
VRTVHSECLDWLLVVNQQHLERVPDVFVDHYNRHWPHRALALNPLHPTHPPFASATQSGETGVQLRDGTDCLVRKSPRLVDRRVCVVEAARILVSVTLTTKRDNGSPTRVLGCRPSASRGCQGIAYSTTATHCVALEGAACE